MNTVRYKVPDKKKLWRGCVSVRSNILERCHNSGMDLTIVYQDGEMTIPNDQLTNRARGTSGPFLSKFDGAQYYLIDYFWTPNAEGKVQRQEGSE